MLKEVLASHEKESIATTILQDLPDWFGLPDSTQSYIDESKHLPFLAYYVEDKPVGFIVLKKTSPDCGDIFVMGILKNYHRQGIGQQLYRGFEQLANRLGYSYLQVKTVKMGHYATYDISNRFYMAMGFKELECFPDMWDEWNPCQIYVKYIGER